MQLCLSIIIVNYNSREVLNNCLRSIIKQSFNFSFEIIVVDNASVEKIADLEVKYPGIKFLFNRNNLGFAAANNIGIRQANGKFILLLNPDTIVNENSFQPMIEYLAENKDVGIVGCRIFNLNGEIERSTHSFPTLSKEFVHANEFIKNLLSYDSFLGKSLKKFLKGKSFESYWDHNSIKEVDHVTGACMMVKKEVIDKVGALDEAFFLYNEEVEWSLRIKKAGYKSVFLPNCNIIHLFGHSTKQMVQKQTINRLLVERYRGMFYFFQKHYGFGNLLLLRIIVLQGFCFRLFFNYFLTIIANDDQKNRIKTERKYIKEILALTILTNFDWRKTE